MHTSSAVPLSYTSLCEKATELKDNDNVDIVSYLNLADRSLRLILNAIMSNSPLQEEPNFDYAHNIELRERYFSGGLDPWISINNNLNSNFDFHLGSNKKEELYNIDKLIYFIIEAYLKYALSLSSPILVRASTRGTISKSASIPLSEVTCCIVLWVFGHIAYKRNLYLTKKIIAYKEFIKDYLALFNSSLNKDEGFILHKINIMCSIEYEMIKRFSPQIRAMTREAPETINKLNSSMGKESTWLNAIVLRYLMPYKKALHTSLIHQVVGY